MRHGRRAKVCARRRASLCFFGVSVIAAACTSRTQAVSTYDDGALNARIERLGPARDGDCLQWYPDGRQALEAHYRLGLRDGPWRVWHPNGTPAIEGAFVDGLREGPWTEWSAEGVKLLEGTWTAGDKSGTWSEYDEQGRRVAREIFENGTRLARLPG